MLMHVVIVACIAALLIMLHDWQLSSNMEIFNWFLYTVFIPLPVVVFSCRYAVLSCRPDLVANVLPALYIMAAVAPLSGGICFFWGIFQNTLSFWLGLVIGAFGSFGLFLAVHKYRTNFELYCQDQKLELWFDHF